MTFILYGLAVALSDGYPRWLGWLALVDGIVGVGAGVVYAYQGPTELVSNVLVSIVIGVLTIWLLAMGVLMWRKASPAA